MDQTGPEDNVASQVRHLFKLPKPGPVYFRAVKAALQGTVYSTAAAFMNAGFNNTNADKNLIVR